MNFKCVFEKALHSSLCFAHDEKENFLAQKKTTQTTSNETNNMMNLTQFLH